MFSYGQRKFCKAHNFIAMLTFNSVCPEKSKAVNHYFMQLIVIVWLLVHPLICIVVKYSEKI